MMTLRQALQSAFKPQTFADFPYSHAASFNTLCAVQNGTRLLDQDRDSSGIKGLVLHGPNGTGKSELSKLIPPIFEASASFPTTSQVGATWNNACVNTTRVTNANAIALVDQIENRCSQIGSESPKGWHYEIIDEAGQLTKHAQGALKGLMDQLPCTIFIFTTNNWLAFDSGLKSRCYELEMDFAPVAALVARGQQIIKNAGAALTPGRDQRIHRAAQQSGGDLRSLGSHLQDLYSDIMGGKV